ASSSAADHLLQHLFVKRRIGDYPAQPRILHLELPQLLHFGWHQAAVELLPAIERRSSCATPRRCAATALQMCGKDHQYSHSFRTVPLLRPGKIYEKFKASEHAFVRADEVIE